MKFGEYLKATRTSRGHTKAEAIRQIGCTRPTYDSWEAGMYVPEETWNADLAHYLSVPQVRIDQYCGRVGERQANLLIENGVTELRPYLSAVA